MIKAIIFDLGGVLFTNGTAKFIDFISQTYGIDREKVRSVMNTGIGTLYREAKISRDEFWQQAISQLSLSESMDDLEKKWIDKYKLIEGTKKLLFELKRKYKVYFLSDNVKERIDKIDEKYGFLFWFDGGVFSHEVGIRKPNPAVYKITLEKFGLKPEEAVFIDDKEEMLVPAREMGITTFLFKSPEGLSQDLKSLKII